MLIVRKALLAASMFVAATTAAYAADDGKPEIGTWGFDLSAMDKSVKPGDDFFHYTGGTWMKTHTIPADKTSYGSFVMLRDKAEADVKDSVDANAKTPHAAGSVEQKVADYYNTFLDTKTIESKGIAAAKPDLDRIANLKDLGEMTAFMAEPGMPGGAIGMGQDVDAKNSNVYILSIGQSGLGLPDRDYYMRTEKQFQDIRTAYQAHIAKMLKLANYPDADKYAAAILATETEIAKLSWDKAKRRDPVATYNPMTHDQLVAFAPDYDWDTAFKALGLSGFDRFVVNEKDAVQKLATLQKSTSLDIWKAYLTYHYLESYASILPKAFDDESFAFASTISGQKEQRPRWKRAISSLNGALGEAVGQVYVQRHFSPEAKASVLQLVNNLRDAYRLRIKNLTWMGDDTKKEAFRKLDTLRIKMGYPDKWRDYSAFNVVAGDALGNAKRSAEFEWQREVKRINNPVDKDEWFMSPQTVNAYYNPTFNEIVFPAAILQAPFFDKNADMAVNYGGIGAVIGHEMGHGFDDQGSKMDADGVLRDWWTKEDEERFGDRVKHLGEQYSTYEPIPGDSTIKVNGALTMGENIGDLGGINVAHQAYETALAGKTPEVKDGFTGEQRFFLGFGQIWRSISKPEQLRNQVLSDPHSPPEFRVNGVVRNVDDWYTAFSIQPTDKLYLAADQRVHIW